MHTIHARQIQPTVMRRNTAICLNHKIFNDTLCFSSFPYDDIVRITLIIHQYLAFLYIKINRSLLHSCFANDLRQTIYIL